MNINIGNNGKGDAPRKRQISQEKWRENHDAIDWSQAPWRKNKDQDDRPEPTPVPSPGKSRS